MPLFRRFLLVVAILLAAAPAGAATGPATKFVADLGSQALRMLADKASPQRREQEFRRLFVSHFDVDTIARFVVGNYWRTASDAERTEYRKLFEDYVVAAYSARLSNYSGEQFQVKDEVPAGDDTMVNSVIIRANQPPAKVEWRVRKYPDGSLKIVDVVVEGVSMTITQRSEFSSVMQQSGGLPGLNAKLREKLGKA